MDRPRLLSFSTQEQIAAIRDDLLKLGSVQELVTRGIALPKLGHVLMLRRNGHLAAYDMCHNVEDLGRELSKLEQRVQKLRATGDNLARSIPSPSG